MLNKISPVDYSVFALSLLVPALVALYYAFVQRQKTTDAYFLGNRKMGAVPLAFSLAASYLSATTITGELLEWILACRSVGIESEHLDRWKRISFPASIHYFIVGGVGGQDSGSGGGEGKSAALLPIK